MQRREERKHTFGNWSRITFSITGMSLYSSIWPFQTIVWQVKRAYLHNQYVYHEQDISHLADRNTAVHLHLEHLRKVSSLTKKAAKSTILHGFAAWFDGEIDGYSIMARFSRSIFFFFNSKDECTYLFSVIFTLECPKISLRLLISNPSSTHLVAKVCLSAW